MLCTLLTYFIDLYVQHNYIVNRRDTSNVITTCVSVYLVTLVRQAVYKKKMFHVFLMEKGQKILPPFKYQ